MFPDARLTKETAFAKAIQLAQDYGLRITHMDADRPWGGFLVLDEQQADAFIHHFFSEIAAEDISAGRKISPKILLVAPAQRLSWQYHFRRAELWRVLMGPVAVSMSEDDVQPETPRIFQEGAVIRLKQGERHRLIGLQSWGMVAEIWQHTDTSHPSDEEDIVRLQDDYGR